MQLGREKKSKFIHANCYSNAKSGTAAKFLKELVGKIPYKIRSIQVDGGSEFMKEFEEACRELRIPLLVLPPARPQYNGGVERSNRIFREEFYAGINMMEDTVCGLKGLTPMEYVSRVLEAQPLSHII